jgi:hypothetical protein
MATQAERDVIEAARGYIRDVASMDARGRAAAFDRLCDAARELERAEEEMRHAGEEKPAPPDGAMEPFTSGPCGVGSHASCLGRMCITRYGYGWYTVPCICPCHAPKEG